MINGSHCFLPHSFFDSIILLPLAETWETSSPRKPRRSRAFRSFPNLKFSAFSLGIFARKFTSCPLPRQTFWNPRFSFCPELKIEYSYKRYTTCTCRTDGPAARAARTGPEAARALREEPAADLVWPVDAPADGVVSSAQFQDGNSDCTNARLGAQKPGLPRVLPARLSRHGECHGDYDLVEGSYNPPRKNCSWARWFKQLYLLGIFMVQFYT